MDNNNLEQIFSDNSEEDDDVDNFVFLDTDTLVNALLDYIGTEKQQSKNPSTLIKKTTEVKIPINGWGIKITEVDRQQKLEIFTYFVMNKIQKEINQEIFKDAIRFYALSNSSLNHF